MGGQAKDFAFFGNCPTGVPWVRILCFNHSHCQVFERRKNILGIPLNILALENRKMTKYLFVKNVTKEALNNVQWTLLFNISKLLSHDVCQVSHFIIDKFAKQTNPRQSEFEQFYWVKCFRRSAATGTAPQYCQPNPAQVFFLIVY